MEFIQQTVPIMTKQLERLAAKYWIRSASFRVQKPIYRSIYPFTDLVTKTHALHILCRMKYYVFCTA